MNFNKRIKLNNNYRVNHERRRAAKYNVDQNMNDNNNETKRENKLNKELKERKHLLNMKLKKLRKIKKGNEYRYQSSSLGGKEEVRKKYERENAKIEDKIRNINNEKQFIIRLRERNSRLIKENKDIKAKLEESLKENIVEKEENEIREENGRASYLLCNIKRIIQYLRNWLTML